MKRKGAPAKEGKCPRDAPKDQKCDNCRSKKGACQFAARIAAANATLSPGEPSTSERPRSQAAADSDMDDAEPRPSRERKAPERIEVEIEVTRRDLVHAEYSLKKSDCYRQICDIGEPGVVVCRHRSCHQCRHDHEDEVGGDCIDLDFARCKEEAHCGAPQERALTAVQFEQDEEAMEFRALALQEQARRIQSGEIVCVANHDVETKSCLPFLIGKVIGESYQVEQDDPDSTFGSMKRGDVVKNFLPYAPIKFGSAYYKRPTSEQAFPVYVENIIVRDIQLLALPKQPDILQLRAEDSKKIVLVLPREGWFFHFRPSLPWDASAVTATGRVTDQHKLRLAADESYLAASLKVPPPKKKTLRSEGASQRLIRERQRDGVTLRLRPRPARE